MKPVDVLSCLIVTAIVLEVDESEFTLLKRSVIGFGKKDTDGLT